MLINIEYFITIYYQYQDSQVLWDATTAIRNRLTRYTVPVDQQCENESEKLWQHVSAAIEREDMNAATEEKTILEEAQRSKINYQIYIYTYFVYYKSSNW